MNLEVIKDPATIARAMRDTTEPGPRAPIRPDTKVRCVQNEAGWVVVRGREVLGSHPSLTLARIHQLQAEGAA